jgi:formylmethanofuran dehydrogenase subunit E
MSSVEELVEISSRDHCHVCPRQVLGVRIGLAGLAALGFAAPPDKKRLLVIAETDGCFVDGLSAGTGCTVGHRTLRIEDYGKVAAVFVSVETGQAVRFAPAPDVRQRAYAYAPDEPRHYFAQLQAYKIMPEAELLRCFSVQLNTPIEAIVSRPGIRVNCDLCGEEIINQRGIDLDGQVFCRACVGEAYYRHEHDPIELISLFKTRKNSTAVLSNSNL